MTNSNSKNDLSKILGNQFGKCFCVFCNEVINIFQNVVLVCTHSFHEKCLDNWEKNFCPICRKSKEILKVFPKKVEASFSKPIRRHPTGDILDFIENSTNSQELEEKYLTQFHNVWNSENVKDLVPKSLFNEGKKSLMLAKKLMLEKQFEKSFEMVLRCDHLLEILRECSEFWMFLKNNEPEYRAYREMTIEILEAFHNSFNRTESINQSFKVIPPIVIHDSVDKDKFSFST